jgi:hypothetical protein
MRFPATLLFLTAVLLNPILAGCHGDPDDEAIRALVESMRTTAETKSFHDTLAPIAPEYSDNFNERKGDIKDRLDRTFAEYDRLVIKMAVEKLERKGVFATVTMKLKITGMSGSRREFVFGSPLAGKKVILDLEKREGRWWVTGGQIGR